MKRHFKAFTLLELLLALAITSILIALSMPVYTDHIARAQRNRATVALVQLAARMEEYYSDNDTYKPLTLQILHADDLEKNLQYQLAISQLSDTHYEIQAIPIGAQVQRDSRCGTLILTDTNERKISGNGDISQCWM